MTENLRQHAPRAARIAQDADPEARNPEPTTESTERTDHE